MHALFFWLVVLRRHPLPGADRRLPGAAFGLVGQEHRRRRTVRLAAWEVQAIGQKAGDFLLQTASGPASANGAAGLGIIDGVGQVGRLQRDRTHRRPDPRARTRTHTRACRARTPGRNWPALADGGLHRARRRDLPAAGGSLERRVLHLILADEDDHSARSGRRRFQFTRPQLRSSAAASWSARGAYLGLGEDMGASVRCRPTWITGTRWWWTGGCK